MEGLCCVASMQARPQKMVFSITFAKYCEYIRAYLCFLCSKKVMGGNKTRLQRWLGTLQARVQET